MNQKTNLCIFCGQPGSSREHIFSQWLHKVVPTDSHRNETAYWHDNQGHRTVSQKLDKQGGVHTKVTLAPCEDCNNIWMSGIVDIAKPIVDAVTHGRQIFLGEREQLILANWIALSAMMADAATKSKFKLPDNDRANMYTFGTAPPHWYIGIGQYDGPENYAAFQTAIRVSPSNSFGPPHIVHSITMIWGKLFGIVHAVSPSQHPRARIIPIENFYPHIKPIWPRFEPITFPLNEAEWIIGSLNPDGLLARDIAVRISNEVQAETTRLRVQIELG